MQAQKSLQSAPGFKLINLLTKILHQHCCILKLFCNFARVLINWVKLFWFYPLGALLVDSQECVPGFKGDYACCETSSFGKKEICRTEDIDCSQMKKFNTCIGFPICFLCLRGKFFLFPFYKHEKPIPAKFFQNKHTD